MDRVTTGPGHALDGSVWLPLGRATWSSRNREAAALVTGRAGKGLPWGVGLRAGSQRGASTTTSGEALLGLGD